MRVSRAIRHILTTRYNTRHHFTVPVRDAIAKAIADAEAAHGGEIRFVVETAFDLPELWRGLSVRHRALQLFGQFGVWDTASNNGVLIYVLMADHGVEIIADRGIAQFVTPHEWQAVCRLMEQHYRAGRFREGSIAGVEAVAALLGRHFPGKSARDNELPNQPVLL
jgi:uncharacterized membrane protein